MVEYICFTVDLTDKKKNNKSNVKEEDRAEEAVDGNSMMESTQAEHSEENQKYKGILVDVDGHYDDDSVILAEGMYY